MAGDAFKAKLARVEALRALTDEAALVTGLRRALADRNNYVVARAADVAGARYATAVVPDLLAAYARLYEPESDPLVLAKNALATALKELDFRDPTPFVRGLTHVQFEGTWGRLEDRAGPLRATCAHALVACEIDSVPLLRMLVERLVDAEVRVRCEVVRAVAQTGGDESMLLLRLKALAGDREAEVLGECFAALLDREPQPSVPFVARFVSDERVDVAAEAAGALAAAREPAALASVVDCWRGDLPTDVRRAIIFGCGASRLEAAADFLLTVIEERRADLAIAALSALGTSRYREAVSARTRAAADACDDAAVTAAFERAFERG